MVEIANHIGLGAVQLHGHETAEDSRWVRERVPCTIKAFAAGDRAIGRFAEFGADYLLIDGPSPGSGEVFDWRLAEGVADPSRLIVSGGLHPGNVAQAIAHLRPFGVDVASGVESRRRAARTPPRCRRLRGQRPAGAARELTRPRARATRRRPAGGAGRAAASGPYDWMDG